MVKKYSRRYLLTHLRYIQFFSSSSDNRLKKPPRNSKFTKTKLIHRSSIVPRKERKKKTKDRNKGIFVCGRGNEVDLICTTAWSSSWQLQVARCARIWKYSVYPPYRAGDPRESKRERERVSPATINARHFSTSSCVNNTGEFSAVFRILFDGQHRFPCARGSQRGRKRASGCLARVMYLPERKGHLHTANSTREGSGG